MWRTTQCVLAVLATVPCAAAQTQPTSVWDADAALNQALLGGSQSMLPTYTPPAVAIAPKETAIVEEPRAFSKMSLSKVRNTMREMHQSSASSGYMIDTSKVPSQLSNYMGWAKTAKKSSTFSTNWKTSKATGPDMRTEYMRVLQDGEPAPKAPKKALVSTVSTLSHHEDLRWEDLPDMNWGQPKKAALATQNATISQTNPYLEQMGWTVAPAAKAPAEEEENPYLADLSATGQKKRFLGAVEKNADVAVQRFNSAPSKNKYLDDIIPATMHVPGQ